MCDPLTIGGAVLSAGAMAANQAASDQVAGARSGVMGAEMNRQDVWDRQANQANDRARDRYKGTADDMDAKKAEVAKYFAGGEAGVPTAGPTAGGMPASSSNIIVQEGKKQGDKVAAFGQQQGGALADVRSFGDVLGDTGRGVARDASDIGTIGSFKRDSSAVVPMELQHANSAGNDMKMLGDILAGAGQVGMTAGLSGANPFGGAGAEINTSGFAKGAGPRGPSGGAMASQSPVSFFSFLGR